MLGGVGGARVSTQFDAVWVGGQPTDTFSRWSGAEVRDLLERVPGSGAEAWAVRFRALPVFVEEDVISNTLFPDGQSLDQDSLSDRHKGKGYMALIDGSVLLQEPYLETPIADVQDADASRPNGAEFAGIAVRRFGARTDYIGQANISRINPVRDRRTRVNLLETQGYAVRYGWINSPALP